MSKGSPRGPVSEKARNLNKTAVVKVYIPAPFVQGQRSTTLLTASRLLFDGVQGVFVRAL
jgi:hypothetical protein